MNPYLAAMYNTHGYGEAVQEEQTKIAHLDLFCKAAAAENIDLSTMPPGERDALYSAFIQKLAEEEEEEGAEHEKKESPAKEEGEQEEGDDDEGDKEAAARREYAAQQEWLQKQAEADFLGRQMAHAFCQERAEIEKEAAELEKEALFGRGKEKQKFQPAHKSTVLGVGGKGAPGGSADKVEKGLFSYAKQRKSLGEKAREGLGAASKKLQSGAKAVGSNIKSNKGKYLAAGAGLAAAGAGAAGYAAGKKKDSEKTGSAFDLQAAERGLEIAKEAGYDEDQVIERLNALLVLGPGEAEKTASPDAPYETALDVRGLELIERIGVPVDWDAVNEALS